jgi:hypothetical protein
VDLDLAAIVGTQAPTLPFEGLAHVVEHALACLLQLDESGIRPGRATGEERGEQSARIAFGTEGGLDLRA